MANNQKFIKRKKGDRTIKINWYILANEEVSSCLSASSLHVWFHIIYFDTMPEEDSFQATKIFVKKTRKGQIKDQSKNIGLDLVTLVQNILS